MGKTKEATLQELGKTITQESEVEFLKYLVDCCENILESKQMLEQYSWTTPPMLQLIKLRAEVSNRLENKGVYHGKYATGDHLLSFKRRF